MPLDLLKEDGSRIDKRLVTGKIFSIPEGHHFNHEASILGWRQFWMTTINRSAKNLKPDTALTQEEIQILDILAPTANKSGRKNLTLYLTKIAQLGGYLARAKAPPPSLSLAI